MSPTDPTATQILHVPAQPRRKIELECIALEVLSGPDVGLKCSLPLPSIKIGSSPDNDVVLSDRGVSRHHALISQTAGGLKIRDLGSTNGSYCNGVRVIEAFLRPDVELCLGETLIRTGRHTEARDYEIGEEQGLGSLVGASAPMRKLYGLIKVVAPTPTTVLITGESGSGKEVVAQTIHELSERPGPLVVFDASVTDPEMVRNDLFGHIKGAFTGATGGREGAFRRADGGTLFIDEIGELPLELQPRLLRVLETREVIPVGSDTPHEVDVRVIAATHRNLGRMVEEGGFRADLFYRLSVIAVEVPPLREITEDIPLLVDNFASKLGIACPLTVDAFNSLQRYSWPGNVRELRNVLERAAVMSRGREIRPENLHLVGANRSMAAPPMPAAPATVPGGASPMQLTPAQLKELERQMIRDAMERNSNNKAAVARELDMPLSTLKRRIADFEL